VTPPDPAALEGPSDSRRQAQARIEN